MAGDCAHEQWMQLALDEGVKAGAANEVPVGAVVVDASGKLLGSGRNCPITTQDPTAHAEIVALRAAAVTAFNYRLPDCRLYVTIEPCLMCVGALVHARIAEVVFGAREPKAGALVSHPVNDVHQQLNHEFNVIEGVMRDECAQVMTGFFAARRRR